MSFFASIQKLPARLVILLGAILIIFIGSADYLTGPEVTLSIFYLIPVILITGRFSRRSGIFASLISALVGLLADYTIRDYSSSTTPIWNAIVRLGVYLTVTWILSSFLIARSRQEEMTHYLVHDLRSPLSNVLTGLNLLLDSKENVLNEEQRHLVRIGLTSGDQVMTLVNAILDVGQLESRKMALSIRPNIVAELFDASIRQVSAIALDKGISVTGHVIEGADSVLADADLTSRILVNLISNALKHSPSGTSIILESRPYADDKVVISVADSGKGIPPEWLRKVFRRFVQVTASDTETMSGSGLGLRFCRLAVEAQNGRIWLDSTVGKGTTVTFTLPRAASDK